MNEPDEAMGKALDDWYYRMQMFRMWLGISAIGAAAVGCVMVL